MTSSRGSAAQILVDLVSLRKNYRLLRRHLADGTKLSAVGKADAYGLGVDKVVPVLVDEGCSIFFVATLEEAITVRKIARKASIYVLNGVTSSGEWHEFNQQNLSPVLNDLGQVDQWQLRKRKDRFKGLTAAIHIDTGMTRYGLSGAQVLLLKERLETGVWPSLILSHLACAEERDSKLNIRQLKRFDRSLESLGFGKKRGCQLSLANSSGIFLGEGFHFDLVRSGAALYGLNPQPYQSNKMAEVLNLQAKITQVHFVDRPATVGYGATHRISAPTRVATVPVGYADGFMRTLGGKASAYIGGTYVPVIGRVSMDAITLDVSDLPADVPLTGMKVELIGRHRPLDVVAKEAGTIGYEILARISGRIKRIYVDGRINV